MDQDNILHQLKVDKIILHHNQIRTILHHKDLGIRWDSNPLQVINHHSQKLKDIDYNKKINVRKNNNSSTACKIASQL